MEYLYVYGANLLKQLKQSSLGFFDLFLAANLFNPLSESGITSHFRGTEINNAAMNELSLI